VIRDITSIILGMAIIVLSFTVAKQGKTITGNMKVIAQLAKADQDIRNIIEDLNVATSAINEVNEGQTKFLLVLQKVDGKLFEAIVKNTDLVASR